MRRGGGFTLVEIMAVVAILAVLLTLAISAVRPSKGGGGALGYARKVVSAIEDMRLRTISTRRWQRLSVTSATTLTQDESTTVGMTTPSAWREVRVLTSTKGVAICGFEPALRLTGNGCPAGSLSGELILAPDGIGTGAGTFYIESNTRSDEKFRVTVYRATGMPVLYSGY